MKGKVKIQLFDKNGQLKKEVEKENLITDINGLLNPFPSFFECYNETKINHYRTYCPIFNNLIGGIHLFSSNNREVSTTHMMPTFDDMKSYITSAGMNYAGNSTKNKGTRNLNESGVVDGGYKFVWDFSKGEYDVGSLSLTSAVGGNGFDFDLTNDTTSVAEILVRYNIPLDGSTTNNFAVGGTAAYTNIPLNKFSTNGNIVYVSKDFKTMICATYASNSYTLTKYRFRDNIKLSDKFPIDTYVFADYTNWEKETIVTIAPSSLTLKNSFDKNYWDDNYIYSLSYKYTSPNLVLDFIKIDANTLTIAEEKQITLSISEFSNINSYVICKNLLVINDGTKDKIHFINLNNNTLEGTHSYTPRDTDPMYLIKFSDEFICVVKGFNYFYGIFLNHNNLGSSIIKEYKSAKASGTGNSSFTTNNLMQINHLPIFVTQSKGSYECFNVNIFTPYFASILNLDEIIHKGETDNLKITYTITNN